MKIFLDTADIDEIRVAARWGVLDGVTTNPTLFSKVKGATYDSVLQDICKLTSGPVSAEVVAPDVDGMLEEGRRFAKLAPNIVVKIPMSEESRRRLVRLAERASVGGRRVSPMQIAAQILEDALAGVPEP